MVHHWAWGGEAATHVTDTNVGADVGAGANTSTDVDTNADADALGDAANDVDGGGDSGADGATKSEAFTRMLARVLVQGIDDASCNGVTPFLALLRTSLCAPSPARIRALRIGRHGWYAAA